MKPVPREELDRLINRWSTQHEPDRTQGATLAIWIQIVLLREILRRLDEAAGR